MAKKTVTALVLAFDGIEEVECLTPVDLFRRAGFEVTLASVNDAISVTGRNQITFLVDAPLSQVDSDSFDLVFLPGGPGVLELLDNAPLQKLLISQFQSGKRIGAICAAPKVLAKHGLLDGKTATSHASVRRDLPQASDESVVIDGLITTSQGVGTAIDFSLSLVTQLRDPETAKQIAESIHFPA